MAQGHDPTNGRFAAGNVLRLRHGAQSEPTVKRVATIQKRRLLRQIGLRANQLDGLGAAYLDNWARAQSKCELLDEWFSARGFIDSEGRPTPGVAVYFTALNSARLSLKRLEEHLAVRGSSPQDDLAAYLDQHYGGDDDDSA